MAGMNLHLGLISPSFILVSLFALHCNCIPRPEMDSILDDGELAGKLADAPRFIPGLKCWECDSSDGTIGPLCEGNHEGYSVSCPDTTATAEAVDFPYSVVPNANNPIVAPSPFPLFIPLPPLTPAPITLDANTISYWRCVIYETVDEDSGKIQIVKGCESLAINRQ